MPLTGIAPGLRNRIRAYLEKGMTFPEIHRKLLETDAAYKNLDPYEQARLAAEEITEFVFHSCGERPEKETARE